MSPAAADSSSTRRIGEYTQDHLLKHASQLVEEKSAMTTVFDQQAEDRIPKFDRSELQLGKVLGRGGFCVVSEIKDITLTDGDVSNKTREHHDEEDYEYYANSHTVVQDREFMNKYCIRKGNHARYAIKALSKETLQDPNLFVKGVIDLVLEAKFLSVIRHGHIIKMRAFMNTVDPVSPQFFVVLDRLYETLPERLKHWKSQSKTGLKKLLGNAKKKNKAVWVDRMRVAYDLASALKYLHEINIVYRDLKPDNIRFDVRGDVKIFDFGLARELNSDLLVKDDLYKMTGDTGSIVYMAPEVALEKPYNLKVDVYSFGVLLWQLCTSDTPYEGFTVNMIMKNIVKGGCRPKIDAKIPKKINNLMTSCWGKNIKARPTMEEVLEVLREEILDAGDEEMDEMTDVSARSLHSMHLKK